MTKIDRVFSGSISKLYETHLVPLIFEPCAADLAQRLASRSPTRVLGREAVDGKIQAHIVTVVK
jgi:hypothetical protein